MASIDSEYQRFLEHLSTIPVAPNTKRLANLVQIHLAELAQYGAGKRARSTRLVPLALEKLRQTPDTLAVPEPYAQATTSIQRVVKLDVGPFRGFMRPESFDLSQDITLVYGANGTGKSSLCEALETAMLGSINEAQAKRIEQRRYCDNLRVRTHVQPVLTVTNPNGQQMPLYPNEDEFRFCFIEKNRLDDFARIAAQTPGDQRQLIATLFGIDKFSEFVRGFNLSLDEALVLFGPKKALLDGRRTTLVLAEQFIASAPAQLAALDQQAASVAATVQPGLSFEQLLLYLHGTNAQQGQLAYLSQQLASMPIPVFGVTRAKLDEHSAEITRHFNSKQAITAELAKRSAEVSYSALYTALSGITPTSDECPACGAAPKDFKHNPYLHARQELQKLGELAELQRQERSAQADIEAAEATTLVTMTNAIAALQRIASQQLIAAQLPVLPAARFAGWLGPWSVDDGRAWRALWTLIGEIEQSDINAQNALLAREHWVAEKARLEAVQRNVDLLQSQRRMLEEQRQQSQALVAQFTVENQALIEEVDKEQRSIPLHLEVKHAYDEFHRELLKYLADLPSKLIEGLGERARVLFNAFNRDDPPGELLKSLSLPVAENGKIMVELEGEPGRPYDALVLLSEGHIRCLGLAILMAKNVEQGCPVVIFDDVVNAIDDEHRNGIWRTFFEDGWLDGKQVILTSHAEEFLLRIQQELGAARAAQIKLYKFLPRQGDPNLRVDSNPPTKNYVLLSQQAIAADEKRDALRNARAALESLTDRLWTKLGKSVDGSLDLTLRGPRANWELNNKCTKLKAAISKRLPNTATSDAVVAALELLLGINGASIEWRYLNTGTHDAQRDHEFDRATVQTIVQALVALDASLSNFGK